MSKVDRSKRKSNGEFNGSSKSPTVIPKPPTVKIIHGNLDSVGARTPVGKHLSRKQVNAGDISQEAFGRLMNFVWTFEQDMDSTLTRRLAWLHEVAGTDAARFCETPPLDSEGILDINNRLDARDIAWKYAKDEIRMAGGFAQALITKLGFDYSGYIVRDALTAVVAKDKLSPRVYGILMKAWIKEVGNDDIAYPKNDNNKL